MLIISKREQMYSLKTALLCFITIFQTKEYIHKDRTLSKITLLMFNYVLRFDQPLASNSHVH